jgi:hypothetical protein
MSESFFKGVGGLNIYMRSWHPDAGILRGIVIIIPGFNSHSGYYNWWLIN